MSSIGVMQQREYPKIMVPGSSGIPPLQLTFANAEDIPRPRYIYYADPDEFRQVSVRSRRYGHQVAGILHCHYPNLDRFQRRRIHKYLMGEIRCQIQKSLRHEAGDFKTSRVNSHS